MLKALGTGLSVEPRAVVLEVTGAPMARALSIPGEADLTTWRVWTLPVPDGYVGTLAARGSEIDGFHLRQDD